MWVKAKEQTDGLAEHISSINAVVCRYALAAQTAGLNRQTR
jgi:hypothetical protein